MGIIAFLVSLCLLIISIYIFKLKLIHPTILFLALWSFILFLSLFNLYGIYKPSNEAYFLILLMNGFFFIGSLFAFILKRNKINEITNQKDLQIDKVKKINLRTKIYYLLVIILIAVLILDCIIVIKELFNGIPMWQIKNWRMEPFGSSNPILSRRSFIEELVRTMILTPFESLIPPITAYSLFNKNNSKKKKTIMVVIAVVILLLSSFGSGGGRIGFIYFVGCFLLAYICLSFKDKIDLKEKTKYKKYICCAIVIGVLIVILYTSFRTSASFVKQVYTYFALPPTLLSIWLPLIKDVNPLYGLLTFFGGHSYFFRVFETLGLNSFVPGIYDAAYQHILNAEIFKNVGYGVANAFVTPIYYFIIDGGYPFVCLASMFFGFITSYFFIKFKNNINIKSFVFYVLMMYGVFLTFIRIQTCIPTYWISFIIAAYLLKTEKNE